MRVLAVVALLLAACPVPEDQVVETLEAQGFSDIERKESAPFSCSDKDGLRSHFTATNQRGQRVEGVLCCGFVFKACTVRGLRFLRP